MKTSSSEAASTWISGLTINRQHVSCAAEFTESGRLELHLVASITI